MSSFAPASPYTATNKLFGGQIIQVPVTPSGPWGSAPNTNLQYLWMQQNWSTVYPDWILPQIKNWKQRGAKVIAFICGMDAVITGTITQAQWETNIAQIIGDCASLGLLFHFDCFEAGSYASVNSSTSAAFWFAPVQSMLTNVLIPNQATVCSMEAGMGESNDSGNSADSTLSIQIAALAKAATTIPIVISCGVVSNPPNFSVFATSAADMITFNYFGQNGTDLQSLLTVMTGALSSTGTKPVMGTSFGLNSTNYQAKADYYANMFQAAFGHPDIQGMLSWGGQGPSPDGDFTLFNPPGSPYSPAAIWTDTPASLIFAGQGSTNRNWGGPLTATGTPTITSSAANIPLTAITKSVSAPTVANINLTTYIKNVCNLALTGTVSISGNAGSAVTLSFLAYDGTTNHVIGTPLVISGAQSNVAVNMTGVLPFGGSNWTFSIQGQQTSGSATATVSALAVNLAVGNASPFAVGRARFGALPIKSVLGLAGLKLLRDNPRTTRRGLIGL